MAPGKSILSETAQAIRSSVQESLSCGDWRAYHGPKLKDLELWFAQTMQSDHVRFCSSGTLGIELALRSLHLDSGDEVILSAYDYPGNFRCIEEVGARPVLCAPDTSQGWCLSVAHLEQCVSPETKAVIVSHLHGQTAPMSEIMKWAKSHRICVIEDACQSIGGNICAQEERPHANGNQTQEHIAAPREDLPLGSWGDIGVFSFGGSKLVSAGRGGAIVTRSPLYAQRMRHYCERGNDAYAMSEIQAAVALPQCQCLERDHLLRNHAARKLIEALGEIPWIEAFRADSSTAQAYYKVGLRIQKNYRSALQRDVILRLLTEQGIHAGEGFRGFAKRSQKRFRSPHRLADTEELAANTIVIHHDHLLHPETGASDVQQVLSAFQRINDQLPPR